MQKTKSTPSKAVIILILIIISTFLSGMVFAESKIIHGLLKKIDSNGATENVYCSYEASTNNCVISNPELFDYYIVDDAQIYVELDGDTKPNLIVGSTDTDNNSGRGAVVLQAYCIKYSAGGMIQTIPSGQNPTVCVEKGAEINITNFNSIIIHSNQEFSISSLVPNNIKISGDINTLQEDSYFGLSSFENYSRCIDINNETDPEYFSELYLPTIDLSEVTINNNGSFNIVSSSRISAASSTDDTNLCSTGGIDDNETELKVYNKEIIIGNINNSGNVRISGGVSPAANSIEDITLMEPIFNINFNNYSGVIPKELTFDLISSIQNYSKIKLSTCDTLSIPTNIEYRGICKLVYTRDSNAYTDLNLQNIGINNNNIISLYESCGSANISDQIVHYLFTSDENINSNPIIFGTINSAITKQPINIDLQTNDINQGLYNINNLNQRVSTIQNQENTFFKIFHNTSQDGIDVNLLDIYLFRFKLISNPTVGYSDIKLDYPFKIHK